MVSKGAIETQSAMSVTARIPVQTKHAGIAVRLNSCMYNVLATGAVQAAALGSCTCASGAACKAQK